MPKDDTVTVRRSVWIELHRATKAMATLPGDLRHGTPEAILERLDDLLDASERVFAETGEPTLEERQPTLFDMR
jgi:hypothetical protein